MSQIIFKKNPYKTKPSFRNYDMYGYYCFGEFDGKEYFEIATTSEKENEYNPNHNRQVIDIDKDEAINIIRLLKAYFKI